jgi:hypothetical protein
MEAIPPMPAPGVDPLATPYLDPATIERVVAMDDVLARNAAITRGYHDLAHAVAAILGRDHANWLVFGQWASAEARRSLLGDAVPAPFRPFVGPAVAAAVAAGNAAVFGDVAPPFIRFVRAFAVDPRAGADRGRAATILADLCSHPRLASSEDLRRAFAAYVDGVILRAEMERSADPGLARRRAARILVANVSIGAHEQVVADPFVRAAIPGRWIVAVAATSHMGIQIPDGSLRLDRDVPRPTYLAGAQFPPELEHLVDPEALALAARFGQDVASARDSDAPDWESYHERMGYIFTLLRAYQRDPSLFDLPSGTPDVALP